MSQLFDALRRGAASRARPSPGRTAQGDVVLATLGYIPSRRRRLRGVPIAVGIVIAGAAWSAWSWMEPPADAGSSTTAVPLVARPASVAGASSAGSVAPIPLPENPPAEAKQPAAKRSGIRDAAAAGPAGRAATDRSITIPDLLSTALYHHRAGDVDAAIGGYREILRRDERHAVAHNNLGMIHQQAGRLDEAARAFQRALAIEPRYVLAMNNYGVTLLALGQADAAAAQFRAALAIEDRNVDALVNLALAQKANGRAAAAAATLIRALGLSPRHAPAHYNLAVLYDESGEPARASGHYREFLNNAAPEHADRAPLVRARLAALDRR